MISSIINRGWNFDSMKTNVVLFSYKHFVLAIIVGMVMGTCLVLKARHVWEEGLSYCMIPFGIKTHDKSVTIQ